MYQELFARYPLDASAFVYLMRVMYPSKSSQPVSFETFRDMLSRLNLDYHAFFLEYCVLFGENVKQTFYENEYISSLLLVLRKFDDLFGQYLQIYASNTDFDILWNMVLYFSQNHDLNSKMENHLITILHTQVRKISKTVFKSLLQITKESVQTMKNQNRTRLSKILQELFYAFLSKDLYCGQCFYPLFEWNAEEYLSVLVELSWTLDAKNQSCLFVIKHLIFRLHDVTNDKFEKLKHLFGRINDLNEKLRINLKPEKMIKDDWLTDYVYYTPYDWLKLNHHDYQSLCEIHQNNNWSLYIWSRLVLLSMSDIDINCTDEILEQLNKWIVKVHHEKYQDNDPLATIFVNGVFDYIIFKQKKSPLSLPNIQSMISYIIDARNAKSPWINAKAVDEFVETMQQSIRTVLLLEGANITYRRPTQSSIISCFLQYFDLKTTLSRVDPLHYKFPFTASHINTIMGLKNPNDINISGIESIEDFFFHLVKRANDWLDWFEKFIDTFLCIIEWLKNHKMEKADELYREMCSSRSDSTLTLLRMKTLIQEILKVFEPLNHLPRLCDLFNCTQSFEIIDPGTLSAPDQYGSFIAETKRFRPNDVFKIYANTTDEKLLYIDDRRHVRWSLACEQKLYHVVVEYQLHGFTDEVLRLRQETILSPDQGVLRGEFKTQRSGHLRIKTTNQCKELQHTLLCQIKINPLSTCYLFHGIFHNHYQKYFSSSDTIIKKNDLIKLIDQVFSFIDHLLDGSISLAEMDELRTVFHDKNINVQTEVKKLVANQLAANHSLLPVNATSKTLSDEKTQQICKWVQTYQYYSHVNIIIDCVQKFHIISTEVNDQSMYHLQNLTMDSDRLLREISDTYNDVYRWFQKLSNEHLQLIKTMVACPNVVEMIKKSNFYSTDGLHRFQELRDNLTTQFQFQERNNMILNSWIITFTLCEPFVQNARDLEQFIDNVARLRLIDENSCEHVKVVSQNIQTINLWLSTEDSTMLDNALIMMEHLYKTGILNIRLRRLINEESHYNIDYYIDKTSEPASKINESDKDQRIDDKNNQLKQQESIKFTLSTADINDHRRQLTFGVSDLLENTAYQTVLLEEQLKLLQMVEKVFSIHIKLEVSGHPDFQCIEEHYEIYDLYGHIKQTLTNMKCQPDPRLQDQLKDIIIKRTKHFETIYHRLVCDYEKWIEDLEKYRYENKSLTLFSNRQIMIMIILLTRSTTNNSIQQAFLEKVVVGKSVQTYQEDQSELAIQCLAHYLQSLRMQDCNLTEQKIIDVYQQYRMDPGSKTDTSLKILSTFLNKLYNDGKELFPENFILTENQQYIITLSSSAPQKNDNKSVNEFDRDSYCILLNIFRDRLPADYQILWCSSVSEDDIQLFFLRVQLFHSLTFVVMDIDKMHHRLRNVLWQEQDSLINRDKPHAPIYYFTRELITSRKGLRPFYVTPMDRDPSETYLRLIRLMQNKNVIVPQIDIIYGTAGIGKTHRIRSEYHDNDLPCISINDKLNLTALISSFLSLESNNSSNEPLIYLNISIHAPFDQLNRVLFLLLICGSLNDIASGLTFSSSLRRPWKYIIEVPFTNTCQITPIKHFEQILPILSILSPKNLTEVTNENHRLFIGREEELVARFLKAYENRTIDRLSEPISDSDNDDQNDDKQDVDQPIDFDPLTDHDETRQYIYDCLETYISDLPKNKIFELSFTKFLYRRVRFFTGYYYRYNSTIPNLGSITMLQMIEEAKYLTQADFSSDDYHRIYLVYDPYFALHFLHNDWNTVPVSLKYLFKNVDPKNEIVKQGKNYYIECLAWLIDIHYNIFEVIMNEMKFILTENFTYKLLHIHERKLTKLPLIIEGETGVGKTFLLKFYSSLLNAHISHGEVRYDTTPKIRERTSLWLRNKIIVDILEQNSSLLDVFLPELAPKLNEFDNNQKEYNAHEANSQLLICIEDDEPERDVLTEIKQSLQTYEYNHSLLKIIWKTIVTVADNIDKSLSKQLIAALYEFVTSQLTNLLLIEASYRLQNLLKTSNVRTIEKSIEIFDEFLVHTRVKSVFYRLLLHPGINEEKLAEFMSPICELAICVQNIEFVVFFDEVNTSSCLGSFKEMFMDGTLHGIMLPKNIFFTAAINPSKTTETISDNCDQETFHVHRSDYLVHQLPESLENLKVIYGILNRNTLEDYIKQKIDTFTISSVKDPYRLLPLEKYAQDMLMRSILNAQDFCEKRLGRNSVSQREIQRCFNLIDFFWKLKYDNNNDEPDAIRCIALSLALIYYFRLPTKEDNSQRNDTSTPSREELGDLLDRTLPDFCRTVQDELEKFVNTENFSIPPGVAVNQAIREHIFAIVVSVVTRTPLCIIGAPGQSKTLSFQIVLQNLQGPQLSTTSFCQRLPALDPFFCLGSKYTRSEDIAYVFDRAIKREEQYRKIRIDRRCVVFLDEASLPTEKKMVLKVLHPYLDEFQVSFVAIANKSFDAANANRMICVYRSLPLQIEQQVLAYGCLGLPFDKKSSQSKNHLDNIIIGLCDGYRELLLCQDIPKIFHDRDFIYMLRELRFELPAATLTHDDEIKLTAIQPITLLHALEDNFNGINQTQFKLLVEIFFKAVQKKSLNFRLPTERPDKKIYRDVPTILRGSMKLDSKRRRLYGRFKLVIDESEDESAIHLLLQAGILDSDPNRTTVFRMSDFINDIDNELSNVEILSSIKLCMETGKTILMVNTSRIHDSLYDVFNQNFSIMATGDTRKIFSKVSLGAKTIDVVLHENFQCIVHVKRSELQTIPAPFLSRFQKYSLSINDFYRIRLQKLSKNEHDILKHVASKTQSFIEHFGRQYFYGLNDNTLYSCLLSLIEMRGDGEYSLYPVSHHYTQLTGQMKSLVEISHSDINLQQSLLRIVLSRLIQLVSPESIILKLRTFEKKFADWLSNLYFQEQEHFNIENFLQRLVSNSSETMINNGALGDNRHERKVCRLTKVMIFTRTSSYILSMNQRSTQSFTGTNCRNDQDKILHAFSKMLEILNLSIIENSAQLQTKFDEFRNDRQKSIFIVTINTNFDQQRLHIPYIRQLIDSTEYACNAKNTQERKYFLMLIHSPAQDLYHQSCFPSIFLHNWDFYFFDTCATGSAFYLQKLLQLLSSSNYDLEIKQDNTFCDLNVLFEDCLWAFCSRIQILAPILPKNRFMNLLAYEFYQSQTNTIRRVKCLREILGESSDLQKLLVNIYHQHLLTTKNSSTKIHDFIYQISKDILCGKRFDGLVESIQMQTRHSFINFVLNIFKIIVNDYGLETVCQLSKNRQIYGSLFYLIDFQSFAVENDNDMFASQTTQGVIHFNTNYSCIPQTPLFHLFHQRIRSYANAIKCKYIRHDHIVESTEQQQDSQNDDFNDSYNITTDHNLTDKNDMTPLTFERFRSELITSIKSDKILIDTINSVTVHSYSKDLVSTSCAIIENNFDYNPVQYQQTVEFISRWLSLIDHNDRQFNEDDIQQNIWLLAHIYTTFEYEQTDLLSMYTACRIIHRLESIQSPFTDLFVKKSIDRSDLRETFFRSIFDQLWSNICQSTFNKENYRTWIYTYTFISKYYPSEKVLRRIQLVEIKCQIELMNLTYLIFLNEKILEPQDLVTNLLKRIQLNARSDCLVLLPKIIEIIQEQNLDNSTWMIDVQQWIISICKSSTQPSEETLRFLLTYLNQSTTHFSLPMKQFLFDQLIELLPKMNLNKESKLDLWDRFSLIPVFIECVSNIDHYQIPFHPSIDTNDHREKTQVLLFDLYFFHLRALIKHENITIAFLNKGMLLKLSKIDTKEKIAMAENLFQQLKIYFLSVVTALLLSNIESDQADEDEILHALSTLIQGPFFIDSTAENLPDYLQLFLSTIISKRSWDYLFNFLRSEKLRTINKDWTVILYRLLQLNETQCHNSNLQLSHQIQFTFSMNANESSIFPNLYQPYEKLRTIMKTCAQNYTGESSWKELTSWINNQLDSESMEIQINQLKAMLFLNIYYDYYCTNRLESIRPLINILQELLSLSEEEISVFRALLDPEQYIIGYNSPDNTNSINKLFKMDCQTEFELSLRHLLVNLMAMILLGGNQSFLWTFAFDPLALEETYGFGSTYQSIIERNGVHYDCGCIISENGVLIRDLDAADDRGLTVPAVYVAYFSTFGALAWHLLLCDNSVENLCGPILSPWGINTTAGEYNQADQSILAKTCHFVYARLLSTFHFLSVHLNHEDACLLITRCFEGIAFLTENDHEWIQPVYTRLDEKQNAEEAFEKHVFYYVSDRLVDYKADINQKILQSQIQVNLQKFVDRMPLVLGFQHFQTALHRSKTQFSSNFRLLRFILDSFNILKVTKIIIPLARFYLLLHQTYTQLIRNDELFTISLKELHERAEKCSDQLYDSFDQNEKENHRVIIQDGIDAVNSYHQFAHGRIQPGACNQTQQFETITFDTPVNYLLTTNNADEGNIIMRILSILVSYHNHILELLSKEMNTNEEYDKSILKFLVNDITSKEISISQVVSYGIAIISLDEQDCKWIERLCQASITSNEEYAFININSSLTFDFAYIQSQIIRIYLLFCRINHYHIIQKYQCYTEQLPTNSTITYNENLDLDEKYLLPLSDEQLEYKWNYLKSISLDNLYHSYTLLKQIASTLKTSSNDTIQSDTLLDFLRSIDQDHDIIERIQHYGIRDFPLCHFNHVIKLYAQSINGLEHLFTDVSPLLRMPIDAQLDAELVQQFNEHILHMSNDNDAEKFQVMNQTITELLNDLKNSKDLILQQSSQPFVETCHHLAIDNPILKWIPSGIRCENYVPLNIHLIRIRTTLQETKVNVEEKIIKLWQEQTDEQTESEENDSQTHLYLNDSDEISEPEGTNDQSIPSSPSPRRQSSIDENSLLQSHSSSSPQQEVSELDDLEESLVYYSLFQFDMKLVPCSSSTFLQYLHKYRTERVTEAAVGSNAPRFVVTHPDGKSVAFMCKVDKFQTRVKKIFDDHHYDYNQFVLIDKNEMYVDLDKDNFLSLQISPVEYRIVRRESLACVQFHFRSSKIEYLTTATNQIGKIITHFIDSIQPDDITDDKYLCFCDIYGAYIEDVSVGNLYDKNEKSVTILVTEKTFVNNSLCEINLTTKENLHQLTIFFDSESTWQHIEQWLKGFCQRSNLSVDDYAFLSPKQRIIFEKTEPIGSTMDAKQSNRIDVINQQMITSITLSYENKSQSLQVLTSRKVIQLLKDKNLLKKLDIVDNVLKNFMMILEKENERLTLSEEQMQQTIEIYCSTANNLLHFRLFIPTSIIINYNGEKIPLLLQARNSTIGEVLQMINDPMIVRRCLALKETQRVLNEDEILSNLCGSEFLLVDKKDTCHVCVELSETSTNQCFISHATIADMCKEQKINLETQHVIYSNEIILSAETPLSCFISETPIRFAITETTLPIRVTVTKDQQQKSITFYCDSTISIERLCFLSCHFMCVLKDTAELTLPDGTEIDNETSLIDISETTTEIEFRLIAPPCLSCFITCSGRTIVLPCQSDQPISSLINNMFKQLSISSDLMETYTLFALDTGETEVDFDTSIKDIKGLFSSPSSSIITTELRK